MFRKITGEALTGATENATINITLIFSEEGRFMRYSRPVRIIFGIIILVAFGWYMVRWMTNSVMINYVGVVS